MSDDPADPHASWADRTGLRDESGQVVLVFTASESVRSAIPWADGVWVPPSIPPGRAAALALAAFPGWRLSTSDADLATALLAAGAVERRHAHTMTTSLGEVAADGSGRPTAAGLRVEPLTATQVDRHALRLGAVNVRAYPEGHVDAFDGDEAAAVSQVRAIARGELLGPMMVESQVALLDGQIVGACLVVDRSGIPPSGGPWVIDLFRDPASPALGVGTALLRATIAAARDAGLPGLSLAVSHDNARARRLYAAFGFTEVEESWTLALPKESERPGQDHTTAEATR